MDCWARALPRERLSGIMAVQARVTSAACELSSLHRLALVVCRCTELLLLHGDEVPTPDLNLVRALTTGAPP